MTLSSDQFIDRAAGLSSTDFPAILGLHPFRSALDVWLDKTGKGTPIQEHDRMRWGNLLEPIIRDDYAARHGVIVDQPGTVFVVLEGVNVAATPDGMIRAPMRRGLEIKTHSTFAADYGPEGSDEVPVHVAIQAMIGAYLTETEAWDVVAFWDGLPHDYHLRCDGSIAQHALEFGIRWWHDHVVAHRAPRPDGSDATDRALAQWMPGRWCDLKASKWLQPTEEQQERIGMLRAQRAHMLQAIRAYEAARQELQMDIGDADGFELVEAGKRVTLSWRRTKDGRKIDHAAALTDYHNRLALAAVPLEGDSVNDRIIRLLDELERGADVERFTTVHPGHRRFVVPRSWSKDAPDAKESEIVTSPW